MSKHNIEGFLSNPFFVALKAEKTPQEIESILNLSIQYGDNGNYFYLINDGILDEYLHRHNELTEGSMFRKEYQGLVQEILLEYFVEENCLKYFLSSDENAKVIELVKRKQYNAKLIQQTLSRIGFFIGQVTSHSIKNTDLPLILDRDIKRRISEFNDKYVLREMKPLKDIVDKVASGVKTECYLEFDKNHYHSINPNNDFCKSLTSYILSKHGYNYHYKIGFDGNYRHSFLVGRESDDRVLSLAVVNDENFWRFNSVQEKTFLTFAYIVAEHNDIKHAEKLIDYAFVQACKDPICKYLYENKLGLYISLKPQEKMINYCTYRLNNRLSSVTKNKIEEADYNGFLYPIFDGYESQVSKGKEIFVEFIKKAYPDNSEKIFEIFQNPQIVIQDETKNQANQIQKRLLTLETMLEAGYLGYDDQSEIKRFLYSYYKNFGNVDSILGRMYYRCYIIAKLTDRLSNECLYEIFFDIFQMIEIKFGIQCSYTINHELRDKNYSLLKVILKNYGFDLSDTYKQQYITALLDRKYASFNEVELFPQLEQYGDAIYELAVDNIFFYNPETTLNHQNRESLVKAETQIKVSKCLGLNKLYISNLHNSLNSKYLDYERVNSGLRNGLQGNYIADSLEMIIGVLAKEFGVQKTLDFTIKIILEANPNLKKPQIEKFDIVNLSKSAIDEDYLRKIFPGPFDYGNNEYSREYQDLWYAINKILSICIIGNETKEKRNVIAHNDGFLRYDYRGEFQYIASYLYYGIEETIEKYRTLIESNYNDIK